MGVPALGEVSSVEAQEAWSRGELVHVVRDDADSEQAELRAALAAPIKVRGETIGVLDLQETDQARQWTQDEMELIQSVADQLGQALESARLFEETQRRARYEALTRQITDRIRSRAEVDTMLQTAIQELSRSLGAPRVFVRLASEALSGDGQSGENGGGADEMSEP
jgi:GAF domain-containing protein